MHEPMRVCRIWAGQPSLFTSAASFEIARARSGECGQGEALLRPVILGGRLIEPLPSLEQVRCRASEAVARLPQPLRELEQADARPIEYSLDLQTLIDRTRRNVMT